MDCPSHPVHPAGLAFEGWGLRPEINFRLGSEGLSGLETLLGYRPHQSELQFPYLEDGSSGRLLPFLIPALVRLAAGSMVTWVGVQGSWQARKGSVMVEMQAGRRRRPPRPPPPGAPDGEGVGACRLKPYRLQGVGGRRLLSACGSPIQALVFSVQGAVAEGGGRGAGGLDPTAAACLCPWPWIVPGQKLRGSQWGLVDAWAGCWATPTWGPLEGCPPQGPGPRAHRLESGKLLFS